MDEIWTIVERAIAIADVVEVRDADQKAGVIKSLVKLVDELRVGAPDHPALKRLEDYLEEYRR